MDEKTLKDEKQVMDQTWRRQQDLSYKQGFREGALDAKEGGFEKGLNIGYKAGFDAGVSMGLYNGITKILEFYKIKSEDDATKDMPFENIQNGICYICSNIEKNKCETDVNNILANQEKLLTRTLDQKTSYTKLIDKYIKVGCDVAF